MGKKSPEADLLDIDKIIVDFLNITKKKRGQLSAKEASCLKNTKDTFRSWVF